MIASGTNAFTASTSAAVAILTSVQGEVTLSIFNSGTNSGFFSVNTTNGPWGYLPAATATVVGSRIVTITTSPVETVYILGGSGALSGVYADVTP